MSDIMAEFNQLCADRTAGRTTEIEFRNLLIDRLDYDWREAKQVSQRFKPEDER
jgi:hypothetical protein